MDVLNLHGQIVPVALVVHFMLHTLLIGDGESLDCGRLAAGLVEPVSLRPERFIGGLVDGRWGVVKDNEEWKRRTPVLIPKPPAFRIWL